MNYLIPIEKVVMLKEAIDAVTGGGFACPAMLLFHRQDVARIDTRLCWAALGTSERTLLRFVWEACHRQPCPLPLSITEA